VKAAIGTLVAVVTVFAWQKPHTRVNAITGQTPVALTLFDFQKLVDRAQIKTEGASTYQLAGRLRIGVADPGDGAPSAFLLPRNGHWDLSRYRYLEFDIHNVGRFPANVSVFAFVPGGFGGISTYPQHENGRELLRPGAQRTLRIDLHQRFPDNTETINPRNITLIRLVLNLGVRGTMIDVMKVRAVGQAPIESHDFPGRLIIPTATEGEPGPGKRVYMRLPDSPVRWVLYLPKDWTPEGLFPIIAEYSGNIFYFKNTYSTGKAEQGNIGYGMSKGVGAIWVNLPFLSNDRLHQQLDGFGNLDATAEYARKVIRTVVEHYSGDGGAVFLTGFSRGGAACGYIGLHDAETADVWLGFHAVAGGDGAGWFGSEMSGAIERGARIKGRSSFVTDGTPWQDVLARLKQPFTYMDSQIGAHVDTMFLDNRPSTLAVRKWMADAVKSRPGVHDISGRVLDADGTPIEGAHVESGYTHLTLTDPDGRYTLRSLVDGERKVIVHVPGQHFEPRSVNVAGRHLTGVDFQSR
jgi:hypothetical protein